MLAVMFALSFYSIHHLRTLTDELCMLADNAADLAEEDQWEKAAEAAGALEKRWMESMRFTQIILRHSEIDFTTESIFELLRGVYAKEKEDVKSAARLTQSHLINLVSMERISLGSIF